MNFDTALDKLDLVRREDWRNDDRFNDGAGSRTEFLIIQEHLKLSKEEEKQYEDATSNI
jgi:hypothetical protein